MPSTNNICSSVLRCAFSSSVSLSTTLPAAAGKSVRAVLEKAGVHNILTKAYGNHNPVNLIQATLNALSKLRTRDQYAALRGVEL